MGDAKPWEWDWAAIMALIAAIVALFSAWRANVIAKQNLNLSAQLEIVKFREKWLYDLRGKISKMLTFIDNVKPETTQVEMEKVHHLKNDIFLMLNMDEELHQNFCTQSVAVLAQNYGGYATDSDGNRVPPVTDETLHATAQKLLKEEWERIKTDLKDYTDNAKNK